MTEESHKLYFMANRVAYTCVHCHFAFTQRSAYVRHMHNPSRVCADLRQQCTCHVCNHMCDSINELNIHVETAHAAERMMRGRIEALETENGGLRVELETVRAELIQQSTVQHVHHCRAMESAHDKHQHEVQRLKDEHATAQWKADFQRRELERRCERLETEMADLRKEPRTQVVHTHNTQTNVQINNNFSGALNLDPAHMERVIDSTFNRDALLGGVDSLVQYVITHLLTGDNGEALYVASDIARHVFKYRDAVTGEVMRDPKAAMLLRGLMPPVYRQARELCPLGDAAWYDAERIRDDMGLRVLEASYDQVMSVSPSNPSVFLRSMVRAMGARRMLPPVQEHRGGSDDGDAADQKDD